MVLLWDVKVWKVKKLKVNSQKKKKKKVKKFSNPKVKIKSEFLIFNLTHWFTIDYCIISKYMLEGEEIGYLLVNLPNKMVCYMFK